MAAVSWATRADPPFDESAACSSPRKKKLTKNANFSLDSLFLTVSFPCFSTPIGHWQVRRTSTPVQAFPPDSVKTSSTSFWLNVLSELISRLGLSFPLRYATFSPELKVKIPRRPMEKMTEYINQSINQVNMRCIHHIIHQSINQRFRHIPR